MSVRVITGDCLAVMPALDADSVDAIVSDPPYGLSFMGKGWDHAVPGVEFWREALRVAKPGAHLVAFGGSRTYHRLACAIEDAGWEIRDCLSWLYGSGFPKSLDVSKAIDKMAGAERSRYARPAFGGTFSDDNGQTYGTAISSEAVTDAAREWSGWGTALKPAWEPIILARKPLAGTVARNVLAHGTGALNIEACRIETAGSRPLMKGPAKDGADSGRFRSQGGFYQGETTQGRWPANVVLDAAAAATLDAQSGILQGRGNVGPSVASGAALYGPRNRNSGADYASDTGGASRFFYTAKASRAERNAGLDGMPERMPHPPGGDGRAWDIAGSKSKARANHHPTVKPLDLMQWLCRLVTPKGGLILDPFCGSGTTGRAAVAEGFGFIGIELSPEYAEIARARIREYAPLFGEVAV